MLNLSSRDVGRVTVIRAAGRIVTGEPSEALRAHITHLLRDRRALVLDLGDVTFIDSTGLGTLVRLLTATRQTRGDLKLCHLPPSVQKLLQITTTYKLFDTHECEDQAIAAFYAATAAEPGRSTKGPGVVCIHKSADVLAYLRELLRQAGYDVHTTSSLRDAQVLLRVERPKLVILGHDVALAPDRKLALDSACAGLPCISLESDFSTQHAAEAASSLLQRIAKLAPAGSV